jgi:hypothetical protein
MTDFAGCAMCSPKQLTIKHHTTSDTRSNGHGNNTAGSSPCAEFCLTPGGGISIVVHQDGKPGRIF